MGWTGDHDAARRWRPFVAALALTASAALPAIGATTGVSASWQAPGYERTIGGTGTAGVYAWGIAYDAATNQLEVGDYWNFYVRSYSLTGQQVNSFYQSASTRQGQPEFDRGRPPQRRHLGCRERHPEDGRLHSRVHRHRDLPR